MRRAAPIICALRACLSRSFRSAIRFAASVCTIDRKYSAARTKAQVDGKDSFLRFFLHHAARALHHL
jgi:hypothetical protein